MMDDQTLITNNATRPRWYISAVPAVVLTILSILSSNAQAAVTSLSDRTGCGILVEGSIDRGDYDGFREVFEKIDVYLKGSERYFDEAAAIADMAICLNSTGGNYLEARKISEIIHRYGVPTRILSGHSCYSACAIIFMSGRSLAAEADGPLRILDIHGILGFHALYVDVDDDALFTGGEVERIVTELNLVLSDLIRFGSYMSYNSFRPTFSLSLFGDMLSAGPDEVIMVDSIDRIARWGIELDGLIPQHSLSERDAIQACINLYNWSVDRRSKSIEESLNSFNIYDRRSIYAYSETREFVLIDIPEEGTRNCYIEMAQGPREGFLYCLNSGTGLRLGECVNDGFPLWTHWYYALDTNENLHAARTIAFVGTRSDVADLSTARRHLAVGRDDVAEVQVLAFGLAGGDRSRAATPPRS